MGSTVYVSATPGDWEYKKSEGLVVEQIIRPTYLVDPIIDIKPATNQVEDCLLEVKGVIKKGQRVLVTTLTKRMAEDLTEYFKAQNLKVEYLHSDIHTIERYEIIRDLRKGEIDVVVGINLLREGLDIPEVGLVTIMDADKEGFLRSHRSLIQTVGRAARNLEGRVIFYADRITDSMKKCIDETNRRRAIQIAYNEKNGVKPIQITKKIADSLIEGMSDTAAKITPGGRAMFKDSAKGKEEAKNKTNKSSTLSAANVKQLIIEEQELNELIENPRKLKKRMEQMAEEMKQAASNLDFEWAANLRDEIKKLNDIYLRLGGMD